MSVGRGVVIHDIPMSGNRFRSLRGCQFGLLPFLRHKLAVFIPDNKRRGGSTAKTVREREPAHTSRRRSAAVPLLLHFVGVNKSSCQIRTRLRIWKRPHEIRKRLRIWKMPCVWQFEVCLFRNPFPNTVAIHDGKRIPRLLGGRETRHPPPGCPVGAGGSRWQDWIRIPEAGAGRPSGRSRTLSMSVPRAFAVLTLWPLWSDTPQVQNSRSLRTVQLGDTRQTARARVTAAHPDRRGRRR